MGAHKIFCSLVETLGYSRVHAAILSCLFVRKEMSLREIAEKTGYSLPAVSLSLDMLELLGLIRRFRKDKSKEIFVAIEGDLLLALKEIVLMKINRGISKALDELKKEGGDEAEKIEKEILRLKKYVSALNEVGVPEN